MSADLEILSFECTVAITSFPLVLFAIVVLFPCGLSWSCFLLLFFFLLFVSIFFLVLAIFFLFILFLITTLFLIFLFVILLVLLFVVFLLSILLFVTFLFVLLVRLLFVFLLIFLVGFLVIFLIVFLFSDGHFTEILLIVELITFHDDILAKVLVTVHAGGEEVDTLRSLSLQLSSITAGKK